MKVLFIGDIVGKPGRRAVRNLLPGIINRFKTDLVIANGENAAGGFGITEKVADELFGYGISVLTSGNHIWDKKEALGLLDKEDRIIRPLNYPPGVPGRGSLIYRHNGLNIAVLNASGRVFMPPLDCPFRRTDEELEMIGNEARVILIDFHAEATSEKIAFGHYLDGRVSAVIGSHTHVQTADEQVLPGGTAYITDVGMTGPAYSVIGVDKDQIIDKFLRQIPRKYNTAKGRSILSGVIIDIDEGTGKAREIMRLMLTAEA
jgi:hypothetical protein